MGLDQPNVSYMILHARNTAAAASMLYAKEYNVLQLKAFYKESFSDCLLAFGQSDNDRLRNDANFAISQLGLDKLVVKYLNESVARHVFPDGTERQLDLVMYNTDHENVSYIHEGISFSFVERPIYWKPSRLEDIKEGMVVEYFNNNKWNERLVVNPKTEWEKMYKVLAKYDKLRIPEKTI